MNRTGLLLISLALVAGGCSQQKQDIPASTSAPVTPPVASNTPANPQRSKPSPVKEFTGQLPPTPPTIKPPARLTIGWGKAAITPAELAKKVEASLSNLKSVSGQTMVHVELAGGKGQSAGNVAVQDNKAFRFEYMTLAKEPVPGLSRQTMIISGDKFGIEDADRGWLPPKPVVALNNRGNLPLDRWVTEFPLAIYTAIGGGKPLTNLVAAAQKAGYEVTVEDRAIPGKAGLVRQNRILISRPRTEANVKGAQEIEVVVDHRLMLPVTIRSNTEPRKEITESTRTADRPLRVMWSMRWDLRPNQQFAADAFKIPDVQAKSKPSSTSKRKV